MTVFAIWYVIGTNTRIFTPLLATPDDSPIDRSHVFVTNTPPLANETEANAWADWYESNFGV